MEVGDNNWTNYTFDVDVEGTSGVDKMLGLRFQSINNYLQFHLIGGENSQYHDIFFDKIVGGQVTNLFHNSDYTILNNTNYHIKAVINRDEYKIYINNNLEVDVTDNTFVSGGIALINSSGGYAPNNLIFDNVSINYLLPDVTTNQASNISPGSAILNGLVNPNGLSTTVEFEYGTTTGYGSTITASQSPLNGYSNTNVGASLSGLTPNTLYHYRVKATNGGGTSYGDEMTFTTLSIPPTSTTNSASNITETTATLNGTVNANDASTTVHFEYGTTTGYGSTVTASQSPVNGNNNNNVSAVLGGLTPNTLYHYRVRATNSGGTSYGGDMTFTTPPNPPNPTTTNSASNITQTTATVNGTVNANGASTTVQFEYGTTTSYMNTVTASPSLVNGNNNNNVSADLSGLTPNTLYHYRIKASNSGGTVYGNDSTFITLPNPLEVKTNSATNITQTTATLNGTVNPHGVSSTVEFEYGTTESYGGTLTASQSPLNGSISVNVSADLTGLTPNTTYHYRIKASNTDGTSYGADSTFTTRPNPVEVKTNSATSITQTTAILNGTVNPNGVSTTVEFEYGTNISYGITSTASQSPVSSNNDVSVSANLTGLTPNTTYHYRIKASNTGGTSYGADSTLITKPNPVEVKTNSATNITQTTATLNGTVNPNGVSSTVEFEYGTTEIYGGTLTASQSPLNGSNSINVSADLTGLTPNTTYHYRIKASNTDGTSYGVDSTFTTRPNPVEVKTNSTTNITQTTATLNGTVNPNGISTTVEFEYGTNISYGITSTASQSPVSGNNDVSVSANLTGLTPNTIYHYIIRATNAAGTNYGLDATFKTKFNYPASISLLKNYIFNDPTKSTSYKLIGLPGNLNTLLTKEISGTPKKDWDAYYDNGEVNDYLIEFDNSSTFKFVPGNGFWIISKNEIIITQNNNTVTLNSDNTYPILLHNGWNIISNPFENDVVWDSVKSINSLNINSKIFLWDEKWDSSSTLVPYQGYYFYNDINLSLLKIPYNPDGNIGKRLDKIVYNKNNNFSGLKLSLYNNDSALANVIIAIDSTSSDNYDANDILAPPADFEDVGMYIYNACLSISYKHLMKESRPKKVDGQAFDLIVKNIPEEKLTLIIKGIENFKGSEIYLLDQYNHKLNDINENNIITLSPVKQSTYEILVGNSNFIMMKEKEILPVDFALYQNYPNPFNPVTTIEYSIPFESYVILKVYDILGREVATLVNEQKNAGYYRITFNASNLSSSVYFYRIQAGSFVSTKKFVLLK